ncbi:hypothetical protein CEXT_199061 [Caerostris extrusa]|uniref:Uncharacterized protein n=1 Tax=Caerostris extrusa TaxID=172846 RepID=A0AAV4WUV0_CAEEX|nr:hypothetical protein CEXT_199061 [Caerostris extrusa]
MFETLPLLYMEGNLRLRHAVPPSNPRNTMYLRRVEGVAKQIAVVKRNDSFKGVKKKKGVGHSSGTCECPPKNGVISSNETSRALYWALLESVMSRLMPAPGSCLNVKVIPEMFVPPHHVHGIATPVTRRQFNMETSRSPHRIPRKPDVSATRGRSCETDCCRKEMTVSKVSEKTGRSSECVNFQNGVISSSRMIS